VLSDPEVVKRYAALGVAVPPPAERTREFQRKFMQEEMTRYTTLMKKAGVAPQ
jgi:hypothetical protein